LSKGIKHIIVASKHQGEGAEAKVFKVNNVKAASIIVFKLIIMRFGCSKILISDCGKHFLNEMVENMMDQFIINYKKNYAISSSDQWTHIASQPNLTEHSKKNSK